VHRFVKAKNSIGSSDASSTVNIHTKGAPEMITDLYTGAKESTLITLQWSTPTYHGDAIIRCQIESGRDRDRPSLQHSCSLQHSLTTRNS